MICKSHTIGIKMLMCTAYIHFVRAPWDTVRRYSSTYADSFSARELSRLVKSCLYFSSTEIIIDGIRGNSYLGDAALDDFSFQRGTCQRTGTIVRLLHGKESSVCRVNIHRYIDCSIHTVWSIQTHLGYYYAYQLRNRPLRQRFE